ncbi:MAG: cupin domain-containing protein [Rhodobacteraceae bacterium]|nr:cupin domain-containing protein [Paracoccaceae bacterium]
MVSPVITAADAPCFPMQPEGGSDRFGADVASLGAQLGLTGLGVMHIAVAPGKRAFPFHNHLGNDELFVILAGTGIYRFGDSEHPVVAGDVCAAPKGGPDTAHQLINTGTEVLRYLGISTRRDPDIVEYPDSGKFGAIGIFPGQDFFSAHLTHIARRDGGLDYWDGEDT